MTRKYNFEDPSDKATNDWMKAQAKKAGKTYAEWCRDAGILSNWEEKKANREVPMGLIGPAKMAEIDTRLSLAEWGDETPDGPQSGSILRDPGRTKTFKVDMPKRKSYKRAKKAFKPRSASLDTEAVLDEAEAYFEAAFDASGSVEDSDE